MIVDADINCVLSADIPVTEELEYVMTRAEDILENVTLFESNPYVVDVVVSLEDDNLIHVFDTVKLGHDLGKLTDEVGLMPVNALP